MAIYHLEQIERLESLSQYITSSEVNLSYRAKREAREFDSIYHLELSERPKVQVNLSPRAKREASGFQSTQKVELVPFNST